MAKIEVIDFTGFEADQVVSIKKYLAKVGKKGGETKTAAKTKASRKNGKLGGRPKGKKK